MVKDGTSEVQGIDPQPLGRYRIYGQVQVILNVAKHEHNMNIAIRTSAQQPVKINDNGWLLITFI